MSASARRANARQRPAKAVNRGQHAQKIGKNALQVSSCEFLTFNSRCGGGCADLPYAEKEGGFYSRDATQKRLDPYYSSWREQLIMGFQYEFLSRLADLPSMGVITLKFVKLDQTSTPLK